MAAQFIQISRDNITDVYINLNTVFRIVWRNNIVVFWYKDEYGEIQQSLIPMRRDDVEEIFGGAR